MSLSAPHEFSENVREGMLAEPSIGQNEVAARRQEVAGYGKGHGGWKDRIVVGIGVGILCVFGGGFLWNLFS